MRSLLLLWMLILASVSIGRISAQEVVLGFRHIGVREGLPHRNVKFVFFDRDGICWAVTKFHLTRIDGNSVKEFGKGDLGPAVDQIKTIQQDEQGMLWLWGEKGCHLFNPYTEKATPLNDYVKDLPTDWKSISSASPDFPLKNSDGGLVYNPGLEPVLVHYSDEGELEINNIDLPAPFQLLASANQNRYWVRTGERICQTDQTGKVLSEITYPGLNKAKIIVQTTGIAYVFTEALGNEEPFGFYRQGSNGQREDLRLKWKLDGLRRVYWEKSRKVFWIEFSDHWELRTETGKQVFNFPVLNENKGIYRSISYSWVAVNDEFGGLWIATENGLTRVYSIDSPFRKHLSVQRDQEAFSIRGIWASEDTIVAAAELDGVFLKTSTETKQLAESYQYYTAGRGIATATDYELSADYRGIHRDRSGKLWIGHQRVVISYDPKADEYRVYPPDFKYNTNAGGLNPWCFHDQENGNIWVGLQEGLGVIKAGKDSIQRVDLGANAAIFNQSVVYTIHEDANGLLWVGTDKGLYKLSPSGEYLARYWSGGEGEYELPYDNIYHFYPASDDRFWIATAGNGLLIFDPVTGYYNQWTRKEGLSDQLLYAVYPDENGIPWVTSDYGLMRIDTLSEVISTWLPKDGLPYYEFNRGAHYLGEDGRMYFGGLKGIVEFHPGDLRQRKKNELPPIRISKYQVWKSGEAEPYNYTAQLIQDSCVVFSPEDEHLYLEFSLIDYQNTAVNYAYRLGTGNWEELNSNNLRISHVPYGSYPLEIRAQLASGQWTTDNLKLSLDVYKPFYLKPGFWLFLFVLLLSTIFGIFSLRIRQARIRSVKLEKNIEQATAQIRKDKAVIEEQAAELKELDSLKTRFFANVSHELRTPLTLILGPIQSLLVNSKLQKKENLYLKLAQENAKELLQKINAILDLAKLDSKGLYLKPVPTNLYTTVRRVLGNFESRADLQKVRLLYEYRGDRSVSFQLDQEKLITILNNLLANALKFTPDGGKVIVEVEDRSSELLISVKDNGTGIAPEDLPFIFDRFFQARNQNSASGGSGIGLALCWELAELQAGKIRVESEIGLGSTFFVELPRREVMGASPNFNEERKRDKSIRTTSVTETGSTAAEAELPLLLIVEDNTSVLTYLETIMQGTYRIVKAINGIRALSYIKQRPDQQPDLIITDLMMPEMDGFELIETLKKDELTRLIPIIVLTARSTVDDRIRVLRFGIDDYVAKPFSEEELLVRIERLLISANERKQAYLLDSEETQKAESNKNKAQWLIDMEKEIIDKMGSDLLSASYLADLNYISARQLQRRLKKEVGLSTGEYIREVRLNEALRFLESREFTSVKEVSHRVGFQNVEYFSTRFKSRFGRSPSSYL